MSVGKTSLYSNSPQSPTVLTHICACQPAAVADLLVPQLPCVCLMSRSHAGGDAAGVPDGGPAHVPPVHQCVGSYAECFQQQGEDQMRRNRLISHLLNTFLDILNSAHVKTIRRRSFTDQKRRSEMSFKSSMSRKHGIFDLCSETLQRKPGISLF